MDYRILVMHATPSKQENTPISDSIYSFTTSTSLQGFCSLQARTDMTGQNHCVFFNDDLKCNTDHLSACANTELSKKCGSPLLCKIAIYFTYTIFKNIYIIIIIFICYVFFFFFFFFLGGGGGVVYWSIFRGSEEIL